MNIKLLRRIIGTIVFLTSNIVLFLTVQPSVSFWDPGEISAASYSLMVPHPPGGPFWLLIGRFFSMIPFASNIGYRINLVSVFSTAFSVLLAYLIIIKVIELYRGKDYKNTGEAVITFVSAAVGALAFAFCDTVWFNAVESNYFALSTLLFSLIIWLMMIWYNRADEKDNEKYIVMMAYLIGLSFGVHLMSVLAIFIFIFVVVMKKYVDDDEEYKKTAYIFLGHMAILLVIAIALWAGQTSSNPPSPQEYKAFDSRFIWIMLFVSGIYIAIFWKKIYNKSSFYLPILVAGIILLFAYPGIVKGFPGILLALGGSQISTNLIIVIAFFAALIYLAYWTSKNQKQLLHLASLCLLFALLGFTTYSMIIIRSGQSPPMNENSPDNFQKLMYYLDRQQYGDFPIFDRRFSSEPNQEGVYTNYSSDLDFWWRYQMNHMFTRYWMWNFVGRESWIQDSGVDVYPFNSIANAVVGKILDIHFNGAPRDSLWAIPFLIGLIGMYFHFKKDWKMASTWLILFIIMGYLIAFYQNQQQPQPRERFYFYPGAWFVFAMWIAIGTRELIGLIAAKVKDIKLSRTLSYAALVAAVVLIPINMLRANYFTHDRSHNWLPWDFSYNLLQSCKPNAILFTNGDNDTFPLWYLQDVEGVRRDVRVVCLSLANTSWYDNQLENTSPYGALKIKLGLTKEQIDQLSPIEWNPQEVTVPVPEEAIKKFGVTDSSVIKNKSFSFLMKNSLVIGGIKGIRVQDIIVRNIVEDNTWNRPIYFSSTCSEDSYIGMDNYLWMEGLAKRLLPKKGSELHNINEEITRKDLFDEDSSYSKTYHEGFKFRGLNNPSIFYDDNQDRLIQNYRNTYVQLAYYYINEKNNKDMCVKTLNVMFKRMPINVVSMDYRFLYDVVNLYNACGATAQFNKYAKVVEDEALKNLDESVNNIQSPYNAFSILERLYIGQKEYDKAIGILQQLQTMLPNAGGIENEIQRIKALKAAAQTPPPSSKK